MNGKRFLSKEAGPVERQLVSVADCAVMLSISRRAVYNMISARRIPVIRLGRRVRIALSDIDRLISENRHPTTR